MTIPALTIRQPWADAIFARPAPKDVENRSWATSHRGPLAVHAGKVVDPAGVESLGTEGDLRNRGVILGLVELVDCHLAGVECGPWGCESNPWAFQPVPLAAILGEPYRIVHWMIQRPLAFDTPIPARGEMGLWTPGPSVAGLIAMEVPAWTT